MNGNLEEAMLYCRKPAGVVQADEALMFYPPIAEKVNFPEEIIEDSAEHLKLSADEDARMGHKTGGYIVFWLQNALDNEWRAVNYRSYHHYR